MEGGKKKAGIVRRAIKLRVAMKPTDNDFSSGRPLIAPRSIGKRCYRRKIVLMLCVT